MAKRDHRDHVATVSYRQSLAFKETVRVALNNKSGMDVYVKVVIPKDDNAEIAAHVPDGSKVWVECPVGQVFLKLRYKSEHGYIYQKGEDFSPGKETEITLGNEHSVNYANTRHNMHVGNYGLSPMASSAF
jgi:hypothetical protein